MKRWSGWVVVGFALCAPLVGRGAADTLRITAPYTHWHDTLLCMNPHSVIIVEHFAHLEIERVTIALDAAVLPSALGESWRGIQLRGGASLRMQHSYIADAEFGVQAIGHTGTIIIEHNRFERNKCAVQLYLPDGQMGGDASIAHNQLTINPAAEAGCGISVQSMNYLPLRQNIRIAHNEVLMENAFDGVQLSGVKGSNKTGVAVLHNNILCTDAKVNQAGINITNCNQVVVSANTLYPHPAAGAISSPVGNPATQYNPAGINITQSQNMQVECNRAYGLGTGFRFNGASSGTNFRANEIGDVTGGNTNHNYVGLHVTLGALVGTLTDKGNKWSTSGTGLSNNWAAWNADTNPNDFQNSQFKVPNFGSSEQSPLSNQVRQNNPPQTLPPIPTAVNCWWFDDGGADDCGSQPQALMGGGGNEGSSMMQLSGFEQQVTTETYEPALYEEANKWNAEKMVYAKLDDMADTLSLTGAAETFHTEREAENIGEWKRVEEDMAAAQTPPAALQSQWQSSVSDLVTLQEQRNTTDSLRQTGSIDSATAAQQFFAIAEQTAPLQFALKTLQEQIDSVRAARAEVAAARNRNIFSSATHEVLKRTVTDIYIEGSLKKKQQFRLSQLDTLNQIAKLCYLQYGEAVLDARAMLGMFDTRSYNDYDICAAAGYTMKQDPQQEKTIFGELVPVRYFLYPNPASDLVTFGISHARFTDEQIEINDVLGNRVAILQNSSLTNQLRFNAEALQGGNYICRVKREGEVSQTLKLVLIK